MKQAKTELPSGEFCFQEVPEDANVVKMGAECPGCLATGVWHCAHADTCGNNFPAIKAYNGTWWLCSTRIETPGNWQLLGADQTRLTEVEAGEIVEKVTVEIDVPLRSGGPLKYGMFKNYTTDDQFNFACPVATLSLDRLAASLGMSKPYCVLKNAATPRTT